jgi:hypothetical protein
MIDISALFIGRYVKIVKPYFTSVNLCKGIYKTYLSLSQRLYFTALKNNTCFQGVQDFIKMSCFSVTSNYFIESAISKNLYSSSKKSTTTRHALRVTHHHLNHFSSRRKTFYFSLKSLLLSAFISASSTVISPAL